MWVRRQAKREEKLEKDVQGAHKSLEARNAELAQKAADIKLYEERIMQTDIRLREAQVCAWRSGSAQQRLSLGGSKHGSMYGQGQGVLCLRVCGCV